MQIDLVTYVVFIIFGEDLNPNLRNYFVTSIWDILYIFGVEIANGKDGISLYQRTYDINLPCKSGPLGSKPTDTPMKANPTFGMAFVNIWSRVVKMNLDR